MESPPSVTIGAAVVAKEVERTPACASRRSWRRQKRELQAPPASSTVCVRMIPRSVMTPETLPFVMSRPRAAQFWWSVAPSLRAPSAIAGPASDGSARPSVGEWTPPIQFPVLPGVSSFASAPLSTRLCIWYSRALRVQASHWAKSAGRSVT